LNMVEIEIGVLRRRSKIMPKFRGYPPTARRRAAEARRARADERAANLRLQHLLFL
jgi:hypothetical protein